MRITNLPPPGTVIGASITGTAAGYPINEGFAGLTPDGRLTGRKPLFPPGSYEFANPHANYDVFPDGKSFLMVRQGRPGQSAELVYLQNVEGLLKGGDR